MMKTPRSIRWTLLACCLSLSAGLSGQQPATQKPYEPAVGQAGKDVVWVPSPDALVEKMLDMAHVTAQDFVMDLGSGDGRTVIAAAKRGARAHGIEYNPDLVELSTKSAASAGVSARATFAQADLFETDLSQATVITMFLLPSLNLKLRPKILELRPGTRIVSNSFTMEEWQPDETATIDGGDCVSWCKALFWVVPAKAEGAWRMPQGMLTIKQQFQMISGTLGELTLADGRLRGDAIEFSAGDTRYTGRVNGNAMQGTASGGSNGAWTATRQ